MVRTICQSIIVKPSFIQYQATHQEPTHRRQPLAASTPTLKVLSPSGSWSAQGGRTHQTCDPQGWLTGGEGGLKLYCGCLLYRTVSD